MNASRLKTTLARAAVYGALGYFSGLLLYIPSFALTSWLWQYIFVGVLGMAEHLPSGMAPDSMESMVLPLLSYVDSYCRALLGVSPLGALLGILGGFLGSGVRHGAKAGIIGCIIGGLLGAMLGAGWTSYSDLRGFYW